MRVRAISGILVLLLAATAPAQDYLSFPEALELAFPGHGAGTVQVEKLDAAADARALAEIAAQVAAPNRAHVGGVYVGHADGRLRGIAIVDNVVGRTEFITWVLALAPDGSVRNVAIMTYREPIGGEIRAEAWTRQFVGRDADDPLRHRREIANIAGATLSCVAVTQRVRVLLRYHRQVLAPRLAARFAAPAVVADDLGEGLLERSDAIGAAILRLRLERVAGVEDAAAAALARAHALDAAANAWRPDAELSRLLASGGGTAGEELGLALAEAWSLHGLSGGRFDPTIRPLLQLWAAAEARGTLPAADEVARARERVGLVRCSYDIRSRQLVVPADAAFDLSAMLKGHALDRVAALLRERLGDDARGVLNFGESSWLALGQAQRLAVRGAGDATLGVIELPADRAFACSGVDGQRFAIGDRRFGHLIDPVSGEPGPPGRVACVIAATAARADALSTAACLLSPEEALAIAEAAPDVEICVVVDGERRQSSGWPRWED